MAVGLGVGVGAGAAEIGGVGVGLADGGVLFGGVGDAFAEAPTLPQPAIARMAAAVAMAAGILNRHRKMKMAVTFPVTRRAKNFPCGIDEWLYPQTKAPGERRLLSLRLAHNTVNVCAVDRKDAAALARDALF